MREDEKIALSWKLAAAIQEEQMASEEKKAIKTSHARPASTYRAARRNYWRHEPRIERRRPQWWPMYEIKIKYQRPRPKGKTYEPTQEQESARRRRRMEANNV